MRPTKKHKPEVHQNTSSTAKQTPHPLSGILQDAHVSISVPSIEKITSWEPKKIREYCAEWVKQEQQNTPFPVSTTQANDVPNMAQLAVQHDQIDTLKTIASSDNHRLRQQLHSQSVEHFSLLQLCLQHGSPNCFEFLSTQFPHWLTQKIHAPHSRFDKATVIHLAFYYGRPALLDQIIAKLTTVKIALNTAEKTNSLHSGFRNQELKQLLGQRAANGHGVGHFAAMNNQINMLAYLNKNQIFHKLLTNPNRTNRSPIHVAIDHNRIAAMMFLLGMSRHKGLYLNQESKDNNICFYAVSQTIDKHFTLIKNLAEHFTACFTTFDEEHRSPLTHLLQTLGISAPSANTERQALRSIQKTGISFTEFEQEVLSHDKTRALQV